MKQAPNINARAAVAKPLYGQVRELILGRIGKGEWGPGDSLPNEFVLANQFEVSVGTIRRAIEGLEETGIVVRKRGRGTYVSGQGAQALQNKFTLVRSPSGRPFQLTYKLLGVTRRSATTVEKVRLVHSDIEEVVEIRQSVHSATRLIGIECSLVPTDLFPHIEAALTTGQHLYPVLGDQGILVTRAVERLRAVGASAEVAAELGIATGHPALLVERTAYALDGRPVEARTSSYNGVEVSWNSDVR